MPINVCSRFAQECLDMYGDGNVVIDSKAEEVARLEEAQTGKQDNRI